MGQNEMLRRYLDAGMAFTQMTRERAEAIVKDLVKAGEVRRKEAGQQVDELLERSRKNSEDLLEFIRHEVADQLRNLGLEDLANAAAPPPAKPSDDSKAAAKKAPAKKAPAKKAPAKKAASQSTSPVSTELPAKKAAGASKPASTKKAPAKKAPAKKAAAQSTSAVSTELPAKKASKSPSAPPADRSGAPSA